jgi:2'-5' RNA ligase
LLFNQNSLNQCHELLPLSCLEAILRSRQDIDIEILQIEVITIGVKFESELHFYNGSRLSIVVQLEPVGKQAYNRVNCKYHYQDAAGNLIFRYDNAPHHSHLATFPAHKHIGDRVVEAEPPELNEVLREIDAIIYSASEKDNYKEGGMSIETIIEAALVILVPEVEPLIGPFRLRYDPAAAAGVPAHITINYPFLPGVDPGEGLYQELTALFARTDSFQFTLSRFARFPHVIYLAPDPDTPFKQLTETVTARFPESLPYGGVFDSIIPHLTIAETQDEELLYSIERQLVGLAPEHLPLSTRVNRVWLMDNRTGRWQKRKSFPLGSK